ncbi:VF530 family protein [Putridiphycobacter roseus]|nr:VF530 family protein [Putridiphycobacter roseus]
MDTENNQENKSTDDAKATDGLVEKMPVKKIKRQATQAELDHPLHGVKLVTILEDVVDFYGWEYLAKEVNILCFKHNPTIKVSLKFLRKFDWAREHVEDIYMDMLNEEVYQRVLAKKKAENKI